MPRYTFTLSGRWAVALSIVLPLIGFIAGRYSA